MTYAKAFAFARPSGSLLKLQGIPNCNEYIMYTLDLSDVEVATFVLEQDPTSMDLLLLIDGALTHFLRRAQVHQCGLQLISRNTDLKRHWRMLMSSPFTFLLIGCWYG